MDVQTGHLIVLKICLAPFHQYSTLGISWYNCCLAKELIETYDGQFYLYLNEDIQNSPKNKFQDR